MTPSSYTLFVGVDIAAASASVSWQTLDGVPYPPLEIAQTKSGWREARLEGERWSKGKVGRARGWVGKRENMLQSVSECIAEVL